MAMKRRNVNLWLDVALLVLFALAVLTLFGRDRGTVNQPRVVLHCLAGAFMVAGSIVHVVLHWDWVRRVVFHAPAKIKSEVQSKRRTDICLFAAVVPCGVAGVMALLLEAGIASRGGLPMETWAALHRLAGVLTISIVSLHLIQHSAWIAHALRRGRLAVNRRQGPGQVPAPSWPTASGADGR
jgi:hypothetical protein